MKNYETLRAMRDADFVSCCRKLLRTGRFSGATAADLVSEATRMSPRAYYVGYEHAYRQLTHYRSCGRFMAAGSNALAMWHSLRRDVEDCQSRFGLPLSSALARVLVECRPPKFFISASTAAKVFRNRPRKPVYVNV